ncbi:hypothetical protein COLO4_00297, partial [Corchorus olitorius]
PDSTPTKDPDRLRRKLPSEDAEGKEEKESNDGKHRVEHAVRFAFLAETNLLSRLSVQLFLSTDGMITHNFCVHPLVRRMTCLASLRPRGRGIVSFSSQRGSALPHGKRFGFERSCLQPKRQT